ncbi:carnitine dehydratase [Aphanothece sacrum FPU1]|uniref:Carnitine dehydratase n=1 Tax=Aphanothece sacrum FPU1 TaxID=1920663 RepID=A0A401II79_APHSA|nr:carnitine dehydratase [Aphanothece sacrum FPU1]GBF86235.1 carnitine dehydratase [Aphanothece sacrum FPU3]
MAENTGLTPISCQKINRKLNFGKIKAKVRETARVTQDVKRINPVSMTGFELETFNEVSQLD